MSTYVPVKLRREVRTRDRDSCAYCRSQESLMGVTFEFDHILPQAAGGQTTLDNLCLACPMCNRHKLNRLTAVDPLTGEEVPLFHPVQNQWRDHFEWENDGARLLGLTIIGRATIDALQINRSQLVNLRYYWIQLSLHPPD